MDDLFTSSYWKNTLFDSSMSNRSLLHVENVSFMDLVKQDPVAVLKVVVSEAFSLLPEECVKEKSPIIWELAHDFGCIKSHKLECSICDPRDSNVQEASKNNAVYHPQFNVEVGSDQLYMEGEMTASPYAPVFVNMDPARDIMMTANTTCASLGSDVIQSSSITKGDILTYTRKMHNSVVYTLGSKNCLRQEEGSNDDYVGDSFQKNLSHS